MKQSSFIDLNDFCEKYDLNRNSFDSMRSRGFFPKHIFRGSKRYTQVDENYFWLRKQKIKSMWLKAHDNYYSLMEHFTTESELAKTLHKLDKSKSSSTWGDFIYNHLFRILSDGITDVKINKRLYFFLRYSNWLIRRGIKC
jgi:hypothetical protein